MPLKTAAEWATERIARLRRERRRSVAIAIYAVRQSELFKLPLEQLELTADELAEVEHVRVGRAGKKIRS